MKEWIEGTDRGMVSRMDSEMDSIQGRILLSSSGYSVLAELP
jgi:hypothetical protein